MSNELASAEKGLSIRGGFLHDTPKQEVFEDMESGIGYVASIGYEFIEKVGFDLGVIHSTHEYRLGLRGSAIMKDKADKTAIFLKGRFLPLKTEQYEIELGAGPAFFSISGNTEAEEFIIPGEEGFSGWGYTASLDLKHFASRSLAITLYLSTNIIKYSNQTFNSRSVEPPTRLPRGNSFSWGLTLFYRIGKISLD
ncbi:MAG: hypothetical protein JSW64_11695 [Candidatus Zixiibacteriota bacterium]|nr:MAG: hypothetical protein JSW64_11695 [candidate division Zixibacteria bacterium]